MEGVSDVDSFTINGSKFGIDGNKSRLAFARTAGGTFTMDLIVYGEPSTYARLAEGPAWSWSLYPPKFYLNDYPVPNADGFVVHLTAEDYEDYDTAIYMMEHNPIESVVVRVTHGSRVEARGKVALSGRMVEFSICWTAAEAAA
ncbi:hypothetical protein [Aquisphaera insulae]|uniref:hypothetical protein n=1 Tax=Aquisphaera insulae TaxID=2712864 RepID=UPI0013EE0F7A|nr:hypothetical protein [Aquisphaera insulae]